MEQRIDLYEVSGVLIAELASGVIATERDATDVVGNSSFQGAGFVIVGAEHLAPEFSDLSSGLAGAVLQNFSTYRLRLIVVGLDENSVSGSMRALMVESNRGHWVWFVKTKEEALARIAGAAS